MKIDYGIIYDLTILLYTGSYLGSTSDYVRMFSGNYFTAARVTKGVGLGMYVCMWLNHRKWLNITHRSPTLTSPQKNFILMELWHISEHRLVLVAQFSCKPFRSFYKQNKIAINKCSFYYLYLQSLFPIKLFTQMIITTRKSTKNMQSGSLIHEGRRRCRAVNSQMWLGNKFLQHAQLAWHKNMS